MGESQSASGSSRAVLWEKTIIRELESLGPESAAYAINDATQVVGAYVTPPRRLCPPIASCPGHHEAFLWQNGVMTPLRSLVSPSYPWNFRASWATGINERGQIIVEARTLEEYSGGRFYRDHALLLTPRAQLTSLTVSPTTVPGSVSAVGRVTLSGPAPPGGLTVFLGNTFPSPDPAASVPQAVLVPAGSASRQFAIPTSAVKTSQTGTITATLNQESRSATLTVRPIGVRLVTLSPNPVEAGGTVTGKVFLEAPAGPGTIQVTLTSSRPALASPAVSTITIPVGGASATFTVTTNAHAGLASSAVIMAKANGISRSRTLVVL